MNLQKKYLNLRYLQTTQKDEKEWLCDILEKNKN